MSIGHKIRRAVHVATPLFLVYYWIPSPVWEGGPEKETGLVIFLASVLVFEMVRRLTGLDIVGLRKYEKWRMAAYAWAAIGLTIVFLTMPFEVAVPAVIGMAWVDPLIGELRSRREDLYPQFPMAVYFSLTLISLTVLVGLDLATFIAAAISAPFAIWVERQMFWRLDDDLTMMVFPALLIWGILSVTGSL
ncbi:MAG: hypothetical protein HPY73_05865 [Methanomassiliicoccales archaeon]|nr:MAG: hypothetical protein HPY73_05865 [Methanomassiliicoccales archaeon]